MNIQSLITLATLLFFIGLFGLLFRRNILVILMSIELMLNAANLTLVAFGRYHQQLDGQLAVFFTIAVAAAESAVGLGLVIALFRNVKSVSTENIQLLKQ